MSTPVIFKDLPATFPEEDKHKIPAAIGSLIGHATFVTTLVLIPLLLPQQIEHWRLMTLVAPLPPPALPSPVAAVQPTIPAKNSAPAIQPVIKVDPGAVVMPTEIPNEILRVVDDPPGPVSNEVPRGIPQGAPNGILRSLLSANLGQTEVIPPPPPPPPPPPTPPPAPAAQLIPVRVGGAIREPKVVALVSPVYPKLAIKARVKGTVVLEATVTTEGTVDEIRVVSGNPLLIQAAIDCVRQWRYEPTYLNGEPIPIILTAKVNFELGSQS